MKKIKVMPKTIIEPFKIKMVEPIQMTTEEEKKKYLKEAHYNRFVLNLNNTLKEKHFLILQEYLQDSVSAIY